ncbi:MAG TPA: hypothetical protein DEV81_17540, partial [Cyanobacteria bacterium UBA11049]|nr:hypothetical protein [Cyanobacteria bacterium UBA11049]
VCCPDCGSENVVKNGLSNEGKQRYLCRHPDYRRRSFIRDYSYRGYLPTIKQHCYQAYRSAIAQTVGMVRDLYIHKLNVAISLIDVAVVSNYRS